MRNPAGRICRTLTILPGFLRWTGFYQMLLNEQIEWDADTQRLAMLALSEQSAGCGRPQAQVVAAKLVS